MKISLVQYFLLELLDFYLNKDSVFSKSSHLNTIITSAYTKMDLQSVFVPTNFKMFIKFVSNVFYSHKDVPLGPAKVQREGDLEPVLVV